MFLSLHKAASSLWYCHKPPHVLKEMSPYSIKSCIGITTPMY